MDEPLSKPTIRDIARILGLNASTVSRALSGNGPVKAETRERVLAEAKRSGYEFNSIASSLRKGVSNTVGIIVPRISRQFFAQAIAHAEMELNKEGYSTIICQSHDRFEEEKQALRTLVRSRVEAIIMSHSIEDHDSSHIREIVPDSIKLIQFDRVFDDLPGAKIINDNYRGGYEATRHLIERGYRKIGTLAGFMNTEAYRERLRGYRQALLDAGRKYDEDIVFFNSIVRDVGFRNALQAIDKGCDALYCTGDYSALGAVEAASSRGIPCPDRFGVVGTADEEFDSLMRPSLTSIAQNPDLLGRFAARSFLDSVRTGEELASSVVRVHLIIRESSSGMR